MTFVGTTVFGILTVPLLVLTKTSSGALFPTSCENRTKLEVPVGISNIATVPTWCSPRSCTISAGRTVLRSVLTQTPGSVAGPAGSLAEIVGVPGAAGQD